MTKPLLSLLLFVVLTFNSYSQIKFEKGYFIDNNGNRTECLIKNSDWASNPNNFEYRLTENSEVITATTKTIEEFGFSGEKYKRFLVNIDRSSEQTSKLSNTKNPEFKEETLFLKLLIEGDANLYFFEDTSLVRYFYSVNTSEVTQLVYKSYLAPDSKLGTNNTYKQQLWSDLKCKTITLNDVRNTDYKKNDLVDFFVKYNSCVDSDFKYVNIEKDNKILFKVNIRPGLSISSLSISTKPPFGSRKTAEFDNKMTLRLGLEGELILPFNKNKWTLFLEPTYQQFKGEKVFSYYQSPSLPITATAVADYRSIDVPIGIRHYFFLNDNSKIFMNAAYVFNMNLDPELKYTINYENKITYQLKERSNENLALGLGYNHNNKYSVELRYGLSRNIIYDDPFWNSDYTTFSIIFGYNLF